MYELVVLLAVPLARAIAGWATKALEDAEITPLEWRELLKNLPKDRDIVIINESPNPVGDSIEGINIYKKL